MSNKKEAVYVKANGLRNELKEIRKSIDKLTNAILMAQTHKHYEKNSSIDVAPNWVHIAKDHERAKDS